MKPFVFLVALLLVLPGCLNAPWGERTASEDLHEELTQQMDVTIERPAVLRGDAGTSCTAAALPAGAEESLVSISVTPDGLSGTVPPGTRMRVITGADRTRQESSARGESVLEAAEAMPWYAYAIGGAFVVAGIAAGWMLRSLSVAGLGIACGFAWVTLFILIAEHSWVFLALSFVLLGLLAVAAWHRWGKAQASASADDTQAHFDALVLALESLPETAAAAAKTNIKSIAAALGLGDTLKAKVAQAKRNQKAGLAAAAAATEGAK